MALLGKKQTLKVEDGMVDTGIMMLEIDVYI